MNHVFAADASPEEVHAAVSRAFLLDSKQVRVRDAVTLAKVGRDTVAVQEQVHESLDACIVVGGHLLVKVLVKSISPPREGLASQIT